MVSRNIKDLGSSRIKIPIKILVQHLSSNGSHGVLDNYLGGDR
jgi:hypothetical protein